MNMNVTLPITVDESDLVQCKQCGQPFRRSASDVRQHKWACRNCRSQYQRSSRVRIRVHSLEKQQLFHVRLNQQRDEITLLKSLLAKSPPETKAAYLLLSDPINAVARAIAERDEALERLVQLEHRLRGDEWVPRKWGLTNSEGQLLSTLTEHSPSTRDHLWTVLYGTRPNGGPDPKVLDVMVFNMRDKLEPHGIIIETHRGKGYGLSDETLKRCRTLKAQHARNK